MQNIRLLLALTLLCSGTTLFSQWTAQVDSLAEAAAEMPDSKERVAAYGTLFEKLMFTDSDQALKYARLENELAVRLDFKKGISASILHMGTYHENIGQMDSA
ncbi:MAG: hypothetical protein AAF361_14125, partial [Bacteroidota bacterium]